MPISRISYSGSARIRRTVEAVEHPLPSFEGPRYHPKVSLSGIQAMPAKQPRLIKVRLCCHRPLQHVLLEAAECMSQPNIAFVQSTRISKSALPNRGRKMSYNTGLGSRKVFLLLNHVMRLHSTSNRRDQYRNVRTRP